MTEATAKAGHPGGTALAQADGTAGLKLREWLSWKSAVIAICVQPMANAEAATKTHSPKPSLRCMPSPPLASLTVTRL